MTREQASDIIVESLGADYAVTDLELNDGMWHGDIEPINDPFWIVGYVDLEDHGRFEPNISWD